MLLTPRLEEALLLAAHLHRDQTRRDTLRTPYITHLVSVMLLLSEVTDDEDILIAGLLHDSLEDVPNYTKEDLEKAVGGRVTRIVLSVTEPYDAESPDFIQKSWLSRKEAYLKNLEQGGVESALVSAADKIHNIHSYIAGYKEGGEEFLSKFHGSIANQFWFYEEVIKILTTKLEADNILLKKCIASHAEAKALFIK